MTRISANDCPVQRPYEIFREILKSADDSCVAALWQHIGNLSTTRLANVCADEVTRRQRARRDAEFQASVEVAREGR